MHAHAPTHQPPVVHTSSTHAGAPPAPRPRPLSRAQALFSGDHLSGVEQDRTFWKMDGRLFVFTEANWYSVPEQLRSVQVGAPAAAGAGRWGFGGG